jgi:uncharacterized delta-60 repeat protein
MLKSSLIYILILIFNSMSKGQVPTFDMKFNDSGKVYTEFQKYDQTEAIAIQSDGKILLGGASQKDSLVHFTLLRYDDNGKLDFLFGDSGRVFILVDSGYEIVKDIIPLADGKILIGGETHGGAACAIVRLLSNGNIDSTFGIDGKVVFKLDTDRYILFKALQLSGDKIILCGMSAAKSLFHVYPDSSMQCVVAQFNNDGILDQEFGKLGKIFYQYNNSPTIPVSLAVLNERILVEGEVGLSDKYSHAFLSAFNQNGLDSTFANKGMIFIGDLSDKIRPAKLITTKDKIIVTGIQPFGLAKPKIFRFYENGVLDPSFNKNHIIYGGLGTNYFEIRSVLIQKDSKILFVGDADFDGSGASNLYMYRLLDDGKVDVSFGNNGLFRTANLIPPAHEVGAIGAIDSVGRILVGGHLYFENSVNDFSIYRFNALQKDGMSSLSDIDQSTTAYPNPATKTLTITYSIIRPQSLSIKLCSIDGKLLYPFFLNQFRDKGKYSERLMFPKKLIPGSYLIRLETLPNTIDIKIIKD